MECVDSTVTATTCKYCNKSFRKLSTMSAQLCEQKRRYQQQNETGVQLGLQAYLRFYELNQGSAKFKNYDDFATSPYYSAFVKFGQYLVQIRAIGIPQFIDWLLKNNKKLDNWTNDNLYDTFLYELLPKEHPDDAVSRSIIEMQRWADETGNPFNSLFSKCSANQICVMIKNGRISPWVLYNCDSGINFLASLNEDQVLQVFRFIDPSFWSRKLKDYTANTEFIKLILKDAQI